MSLSFIIKTTNNCNMDCKYCYEHSYSPKSTICINQIRKLFEEISSYCESQSATQTPICITWHGGEPLLLGIDFYKEIISLQKEFKNIFFENRIQTNGLLLNNDFQDFLIASKFIIGISYDGPSQLNYDHQRNKSTKIFNDNNLILENIKLLQDKIKPKSVGILSVCTKKQLIILSHFLIFLLIIS